MTQSSCVFAFEIEIKAESRCRQHSHPCTEIVFSQGGQGRLFQDSKSYDYAHESVFVYQPGEKHWIEQKQKGRHLCIGVEGCGASTLAARVFPPHERVARLFGEIRKAIMQKSDQKTKLLDLLSGLLVLEMQSLSKNETHQDSTQTVAEKTKKLIESRFEESLSVQALASQFYVSPDYLRFLFRKKFGIGPIQFLIRKRIEHACFLLETTSLSIKQIGVQCGFENQYYFSRMFHKITQKTATQYRQLI